MVGRLQRFIGGHDLTGTDLQGQLNSPVSRNGGIFAERTKPFHPFNLVVLLHVLTDDMPANTGLLA